MHLIICPRCELNYIPDTEKICAVCRRDLKGVTEQVDTIELCSECGENPVVPGQELCAFCLKELALSRNDSDSDEENVKAAADIGIDSVSGMDEIAIDDEDFSDDDADLFTEDDAEDEEDKEQEDEGF